MRFIDEFRNPQLIHDLAEKINGLGLAAPVNLMEVCGGHTITIFKYGLKSLLPENIHLISGPGCPVCVTDNGFIDYAIRIALEKDVIITSFGDLVRVPGSEMSLQQAKSKGGDIRICYSPMQAVQIAADNPDRKIVFLGIGFETTAPGVAASVLAAASQQLTNYSVYSAHKTMPAAMQAILSSDEININGFICPGHVSAITGIHIYDFIADEFQIPCVISGFEPFDMMETIFMLGSQIKENRPAVGNQYKRSVPEKGNLKAKKIMDQVFQPGDAVWRGIGVIPGSGLEIRDEYSRFKTEAIYDIQPKPGKEVAGCICGDIMRGVLTPNDCKLFRKVCTPLNPKGACMVSSEGFCATQFKYGKTGGL